MAVRFTREAWVLLSRPAGDVIGGDTRVESGGAVLSLGAAGGKELAVGAPLERAAGDKLKCEAWMVFIWLTAVMLGGGTVCSLGAGGGEVTSGGDLS